MSVKVLKKQKRKALENVSKIYGEEFAKELPLENLLRLDRALRVKGIVTK